MQKYYITTTAPYVNAKAHIGFALEIIQADTIARFKRLQGYDVFFNFGTDEHGQKIYEKAIAAKQDTQKYTDEFAAKFDGLKQALNLSYDNFTRTTDSNHKKAAQHIWNLCAKNGFIEKGIYKAKYCVGCELEKQDSELEDGKCPLHPTYELELIEEENYFFKFSKLQGKLLTLYRDNPKFVIPHHRLTEINNFVSSGLKDFSISRLKNKLPWGVPVPGDNEHVMYVWFDALTYYISALGWPDDQNKFREYWGTEEKPNAIQIAGKDNLRQQSAMWQAMLMAANLPTSRQIVIHGFIQSDGQKMSKSIGNVIDPIEYVNSYGIDAVRYYLLAKISPFEDSDLTKESFEASYQSDLANGLGNLISRVSAMSESINLTTSSSNIEQFSESLEALLDRYEFNKALDQIWESISSNDKLISDKEVWKLEEKEKKEVLLQLIENIKQIAYDLQPFLPDTSKKISVIFSGEIKKSSPLFPRLEKQSIRQK